MREQKEKVIGQTTYRVTQFGAVQGRKVLARLAKLLVVAKSTDLAQLDLESELDYLCETFAPYTEIQRLGDPKRPQLKDEFEEHFIGRYDEMLGWLLFALEVNFSSFFIGLTKQFEGYAALQKRWNSGSPTPTGGSGESSPTPGSASP